MIDLPLNKLLFFDLETVGIEKDLPSLKKNRPELARLFDSYLDWFIKKYPDQKDNSPEDIFINKAALVAEFSKIIVALLKLKTY